MGLEAVDYYDPPNLTFPFGSYICVVDIDKGTGQVHVRRFVAIDDCGNIINPMIVDGQIHGGLNMGLAPALYEEITYDELGNNQAGTFMDYLLPTAVETPGLGDRQDDHPVAASSDRRQGRGRVGHGRRAAGDRERGRRCAVAPRRPQHRHPDHAPEGVGDPPREGHQLGPPMAPRSIFARAAELEAEGRPFAVATVVAVQRPTSARPGASGIVHPDGTIEGWVGGKLRPARRRPRGAPLARRRPATAAPAVEGRAGRGPSRRRRHRARHDLPFRRDPGDLRGTASASAGPVGRRHHAHRRRARHPRLGRGLAGDRHRPGRRRRRLPRRGAGGRHRRHQAARPGARAVRRGRHAGRLGRGGRRPRRSPATPRTSGWSPRRRGPTSSATWLREEAGLPDERLAALRAPAGIDLGAETPEEIALSILAELVQVRRGRADFVASPGPATVAGGAPIAPSSSSRSSTTSCCSTRSAA